MNKTLPFAILGICAFVIVGSFLLPFPNNNQQAAIASAQTSSSFIITNQTLQTREGSTASVKIKATAPVQKTTRVCANVTPDRGTTSRDYVRPSNTCITFYKGGVSEKSLSVRTVRTATEADKSLTVKITSVRVGTASTQRVTASAAQTAKVLIADQKNTGTTPPVANNNQNTNTTPTTPPVATTPPTDCAQYAGVIPGETRKARVEERGFYQGVTYNSRYPVSALAREQSQSIRGLIYGSTFSFSQRERTRMAIPSGTVLAYRFKTTEYNYGVSSHFVTSDHPGTPSGVVIWSVSKCPGDFTSPTLLSQTVVHGDQPHSLCVSRATMTGGTFLFGINMAATSVCNLEPNTTYYVNISAGFAGGGDKDHITPHIGTFDGTIAGTEMNQDVTIRDYPVGGDGTNLIKGMEELYSEARRVGDLWNQDFNRNLDEIIRTGVHRPTPPPPQF